MGVSTIAGADEWEFGGHAKYRYSYTDYRADDLNAALGEDLASDHDLDLRLKTERRSGGWDFAAHAELLAIHGDTLEARRRIATLGLLGAGTISGLPDDRRRLFDLTHEMTDRTSTAAVTRLDRLAVGYSTQGRVWRIGRQAASWGNGLVFHPLDFVNPFSPIAVDKDYKTGDDMLYGQWTLAQRNDAQAIWVPRRDPTTREGESSQSTYAAKLRARSGDFDLDFLGAHHYDENLIGFGLVRSVGGAVWRLDAKYNDLKNDDGAWSLVSNLDYSWSWGGKNTYGYVEYFRNGVGERDRAAYAAPNGALSQRIARGEVFTLGRDYAALGLQVELDPLFNLFTNVIRNLNDGSTFWQIRGVYDWRQNTQLMAGLTIPSGDRGDEFGGIPVAGGSTFSAPGRAAFLRAAHYF